MTMKVVSLSAGSAPLGRWGSLVVDGRATAVIKATMCADIELPTEVAEGLGNSPIVIEDRAGRALFLPYASELIVCADLASGGLAYPPIRVTRDRDSGMRSSSIKLAEGLGVVFLAETVLMLFSSPDFQVAWRQEGDFLGWSIEDVGEVHLSLHRGDWQGGGVREVRSILDGERVDLA